MTLYRKFGQGVVVLCCVAMFALAVVYVFTNGISHVDSDSGEVIYFFQYNDFQGALLVALGFLISAVANVCTVEFPQVATGVSLLPLALTFYEMAVGNLNFIAASVVLLLALIHMASNALEWYDMSQTKKQASAETEQTKE